MKKPARNLNLDKLTINSIEFLLQRQRLEELLYEVCEAIVGIDQNFKITIFNKMAEAMTGILAEQAIGKDVGTIIKLCDEKGRSMDIKNICFSAVSLNIPNLVFSGQQEYAINFKSSIIGTLDDPKECIITLTDVTRERELDRLKEELFSVASHELKTPITIIKSYLWMLQNRKGGDLNEKQSDYVTKAVNATDRILALVNDILSISRLEQGRIELNPTQIDLTRMLKDIVTDFEHKAFDKGLKISFDDAHKKFSVYADAEQTHEILVNLVENAIKFTKQGEIRISAQQEDDNVKVKIIDTGVGIDKNDLPKLFHKFGRLHLSYQAVAENKGTGLGLYIVKLYVDGMHGQVGALSDGVGKGSTFWFTLPTSS
jgi:signal transduction histidine kinase